ncbi:MAG: hypothetical protein MR024_03875 [Firmicutes bacterium]|nr:hypothetical protein [Bacillota bacterium]
MEEIKYEYYDFLGHLARCSKLKPTEFYENGKWIQNERRALHLHDAMMDYGDYSVLDYDDLTEEQAMEMMKELDNKKK